MRGSEGFRPPSHSGVQERTRGNARGGYHRSAFVQDQRQKQREQLQPTGRSLNSKRELPGKLSSCTPQLDILNCRLNCLEYWQLASRSHFLLMLCK